MFEPGKSGNPKGRPPGSKDKYRFEVAKVLQEIEIKNKKGEVIGVGFNPFVNLVNLALNAKSEHVRCMATSELCSYVAPKLKSVELTTDNENPFSITLNLGGSKNAV